MKRTIVRFQLVLLAVAAGLLMFRVFSGTPAPDGTLVLHGIEPGRLMVRTLRVTGAEQPFAAEAVGSFSSNEAQRLEAYAWIVNRSTRAVAWQMTPEAAQRTRGTLAELRDTITLAPGVYDAYFTGVGSGEAERNRRLFGGERWRNDASHWRFVLRAMGDRSMARSENTETAEAAPQPEGLLWTSAPYDGRQRATTTLLVRRPAEVRVYAAGPFGPARTPALRIEPVNGDAPVWTLPVAETQPAGGASGNRMYRGTVALQPGLFQVTQEKAGSGWGNWNVNPPLDAAAWGVTLSSAGEVIRFAPFETVQPAIAIRQPGDGVDRYVTFRVAQRTPVLIFAMGEMSAENSRYDYGWIEADDGARVWEMEYADTRPAGGAHKNRQAEAWVTLEPGTYRLRYRSDGSHSYGDYNATAPTHAERWGIALFAEDASRLVKGDEGSRDATVPEPPPPPPAGFEESASEAEATADEHSVPAPPDTEGAIVALLSVGNNKRLHESFEITRAGKYRIYATGEISGRQRYDYAVLTDLNGVPVWQMTEENTRSAGGSRRNRVFDGTVILLPGTYELAYRTDGSHAFGDFVRNDAPAYPHAWGVILLPATD